MQTAGLPLLRDDLVVFPGAAAQDGSPSWMLHDPLSNRYFRLSWPAFEILSRWHLGSADDVADAIGQETTLDVDPEDVKDMIEFLVRGGLLRAEGPRDVERLLSIHEARKTSWLTWLLHHYLFFRIPLLRPDAFLEVALPYVSWLGGRTFRLVTLGALLLGLFQVVRQWESFSSTFVDHVSMSGLAAFGMALGFAKACHELGHAFTAKSYGCRVPSMGVAFLVLWPMLYTDVNDAWKLSDRKQRLMVSSGGIFAEAIIAAWAVFAWGLLPDGDLKGIAFTLAVTTLISSLAINLSPFMRFDGYFLVMDALDQPNLHPRSFALARWHLREVLFGLGEPEPEHLPPTTRTWMIAFAWAVWIYRLVLFLGIAVLVYHFFIKVVGVLLFAVEIGWFIGKPLWGELREWGKRFPVLRTRQRTLWSLGCAVGLILVVVVPWSGRVTAPAMLKAEQYVTLYAPSAAQINAVSVFEGQKVIRGTLLGELENPDIYQRLEQVQRRIGVLKYELSAVSFEESFRTRSSSITEELLTAFAEKAALSSDVARLKLIAPISGIVTDVSPAVHAGQWINGREPILGIRSGAQVEAYVSEADLPRIAVGAPARFIPEGRSAPLEATVSAIDRVAVKSLTEPALAAPYGGTVPVRIDAKALVPNHALYRVRLELNQPQEVTVPMRGQAHIEGDHRSIFGDFFQTVAAILIREWGM